MKILITGATGLLGSNLCTIYSRDSEIVAVSKSKPTFSRCMNLQADLEKEEEMESIILSTRADAIIHCASLTNLDYCEEHPEESFNVISNASLRIAKAAAKAGSYLVYLSSDAVFDGEKGNYSERDAPRPLSTYGKAKLSAEERISIAHHHSCIIRTNIYGWNRSDKKSIAEWMLDKLEKSEKFSGFTDICFSPILVNNLADAMLEVIKGKYHGILHIAGSEHISKFEYARQIAHVFGLDADLVWPASIESFKLLAPRGLNISLNVKKAQGLLKTPLLNVVDGLKRFKSLRDEGYLNELKEA